MSIKTLPLSSERIKQIALEYGTPFHLYDEAAIRKNARQLFAAFSRTESNSYSPIFKSTRISFFSFSGVFSLHDFVT